MPGGFGTLDEFFENLTLVQTCKIPPTPMVLMGRSYWQGMLDWVKQTMELDAKMISPGDLDLFLVTDEPEEAVQYITDKLRLNKICE